MFDVDWSDPNRESVGDRRARKKKHREKERAADDDGQNEDQSQKNNEHEGGSSHASDSVRSSVSSVEKQFGFFGAKHRKKASSSRKGKSKSVASSSLRAPTIDEHPQNEQASAPSSGDRQGDQLGETGLPELPSHFSSSELPSTVSLVPCLQYTILFYLDLHLILSLDPTTSSSQPSESEMNNRLSKFVRNAAIERRAKHYGFPGFTGSVFNRLDDGDRAPGGSLFGCDITNPQPGLITLFQELGDGVSMVTKTIETISRPHTTEDSDFLVSTVIISVGDDGHQWAKTSGPQNSRAMFKSVSKSE